MVDVEDAEGLVSELESLGPFRAAFIPPLADHIKTIHMVNCRSFGYFVAWTVFFRIQPRANKWTHAPLAAVVRTLDRRRSVDRRINLSVSQFPLRICVKTCQDEAPARSRKIGTKGEQHGYETMSQIII